MAGDRVLGIRFADTEAPDDSWSRKTGMVALVNTPGLARLKVQLNVKTQRLSICVDGKPLADDALDADGRRRIAKATAEYILALKENPLTGHPERLPLRVIGDGLTPRYQDSEAGQVTLHGRGSLRALTTALGGAEVSELRFRSNIVVDGQRAWEEQSWIGRKVRIGTVEFDVLKPKLRCLATHASPETGERDLPILTTLTKATGQEKPIFAIAMTPTNAPGEIRIGDKAILAD